MAGAAPNVTQSFSSETNSDIFRAGAAPQRPVEQSRRHAKSHSRLGGVPL